MLNIKRRKRIDYNSDEKNFIQKLLSSKSGRIVFIGGIVVIVLLLVYMSAPTKKDMTETMTDNVMQCLEDNNRYKGDAIDDFVHNLGYTFTEADTTLIAPETIEAFHKYNQLMAHRHFFYSTAHIHNNMHPEGVRVGFGFLGMIFSMVQYSDLILDVEPVHKGYEQKIVDETIIQEPDLGTNPNVDVYHYQRNPEN